MAHASMQLAVQNLQHVLTDYVQLSKICMHFKNDLDMKLNVLRLCNTFFFTIGNYSTKFTRGRNHEFMYTIKSVLSE